MHTYHPDVHEHGLQDGCPECEYQAEHPTQCLDMEMLRRLVMYATNRQMTSRSENEAIAVAKILNDLEHVGRLFEAAPVAIYLYFKRAWGIGDFQDEQILS